jgi:selenocysteine lyase/cysteine desulfurase
MKEIYLDNAATSKPQPRTLACAQRFVELFTNPELSASDITRQMRGFLLSAREKVAKFIGCDTDEVALVQNTTHGLGIIANAIPLEKGDNILVCDLEYQASTVCWKPRIYHVGAELREVKSVNGTVTAADFEAVMDDHTKAIMLASVQEINGYRADVKAITELCHSRGIYVAIDGVQEVGAMKVNVHDLGVDFYTAGAKKWIGNPFGTGFLYIRRELISQLDPMYYGYFSMKFPDKFPDYVSYLEDPARHPFDDVGIIDDATKFEIMGFANYLGALGLSEAMQVQLDIGQENIERHIKMLNKRLVDGLGKLGITMCSPTDEAHMSSIASFNFGFRCGSIEKEKKLVTFLQERGIKVSLRSSTGTGGIRISMHYYNTPHEIDALVAGIGDYMHEFGITQEN